MALKNRQAMKLMAKIIQLFQSTKLSGVMRMSAAAPIIPMMMGFSHWRALVTQGLFLNLWKRMQIHSTTRKEGRTMAKVAVRDPK